MTLIKEVIDIPEKVQKGDFVLHLAEDVTRPDVVLKDYVVTPELKSCFDDALAFIRSSIDGRTSKASYLHGSFGSGKSHFMAVLHLILQGNAAARGIPELASVIQKHTTWMDGKKFLLVPYHMIGSRDMESGILGGYVENIRRTHPQSPIPGVYLAEGLFRDAQALRVRMGDEDFLAALNEGVGMGGGWGELATSWDAARFEAALAEDPGSEERSQLISALIERFFGAYDMMAGGRGEAFISLDAGLSVISKHAAALGYHAVILFLDELILWLASHATDLRFVHQEGQKLAKLVEAQTPDRPIPIISLVARQRDLRELIGDAVPGADRLNFGDALGHWEGRFHKITLEDRNLPAIAERRVLKCRSEAARQELDAAFEQVARMRDSVMNVLLTGEGDRAMFRRVYPFSPALVQTLIAVSSVLQRERTALKVMVQLLVNQRDTLKVGDIVPVGDLFDVIAHGDEAFSQEMAIHFENAKRLYHQKLLPVLEREHRIRQEEVSALPNEDLRKIAFKNDDRLVKTLLLSALVPEVESLRGLNAERLAALNHGTIKTPIPGREGSEVLRRCRNFAASVGEVRIGDGANPAISIQLSGVETETIIEQARGEDNQGNRIRRVRQMLFERLEIQGEGEFEQHREFLWRNTRRSCRVLFRNVRELRDESLENADEDWLLVIDFPFDEPGHGPKDDLSRLQSFRQSHREGAKTICWVPSFLSNEALKDLGMLVILEHVLAGERFQQYAIHLSPQDRPAARSLLDNQRSVLRQRVQGHLDVAYGLDVPDPAALDSMHELEPAEHFASLFPVFEPQPPAAADLKSALEGLLDQVLLFEYPGAPRFGVEVRTPILKKVHEQLIQTALTQEGRLPVEKTLRPLLRDVANPLQLGEMALDATHYVQGQFWRNHFGRKAAETGGRMTVAQLRDWINDPRTMGLPQEVQNLVILVFAAQTNRTFFLHGAVFEATLGNIPDICELQEQKLPPIEQWAVALQRAGSIFGVAVSPLLNATNVGKLSGEVLKLVTTARAACANYHARLMEHSAKLGIASGGSARLRSARATKVLLELLQSGGEENVIQVLVGAEVSTSETAMGGCVRNAATLMGSLDAVPWELFDGLAGLSGDRGIQGEEVMAELRRALESDEHAVPLAPALKAAQARAVRLLTQPAPRPPAPHSPPTDVIPPVVISPPPRPGRRVVRRESVQNLDLKTARERMSQIEREAEPGQSVRVDLTWTIEEESNQ